MPGSRRSPTPAPTPSLAPSLLCAAEDAQSTQSWPASRSKSPLAAEPTRRCHSPSPPPNPSAATCSTDAVAASATAVRCRGCERKRKVCSVALGAVGVAAAVFCCMSMASAREPVQLLPPSTRPSCNRRACSAAATTKGGGWCALSCSRPPPALLPAPRPPLLVPSLLPPSYSIAPRSPLLHPNAAKQCASSLFTPNCAQSVYAASPRRDLNLRPVRARMS